MSLKLSFFLLLSYCFTIHGTHAQLPFTDPEVYKIIYGSSFNGKTSEKQNKIWVFAGKNQTLVTTEKDFTKGAAYPFEFFVDNHQQYQLELTAFLSDRNAITAIDTSIRKQSFEFINETKKILGYSCRKAKTVVNSNTIELWYTTDLPVKGAPNSLGQDLGLVLEVIRNGNFITRAESIQKQSFKIPAHVNIPAQKNDLLTYRDEIWKSRFITIPVWEDQVINFSDSAVANPEMLRFAHGTVIVKKLKMPAIDSGSRIFLDVTEQSNGDAYDRTGSVFLIPASKKQSFLEGLKNGSDKLPVYTNGNGKKYQGVIATETYAPPIELMRFFTPFGIKQFNHISLKGKQWQESVPYRQDISDFSSLLNNKEVYLGIFIGNYDKGGHKVNANITIHKDDPSKQQQEIIPLFNTLNIMEMAGQEYATMFDTEKGLVVHFKLTTPLKNARLRYITTGHGGWGDGDEFVPKLNTVVLNGKIVFSLAPWREDCGSYRLFNPASGNFNSGLSSSDLSRSNWCPGTVTNPFIIELGNLEAGEHTLQVKIPQGKPEGTSFNSWNVSGVLIGD